MKKNTILVVTLAGVCACGFGTITQAADRGVIFERGLPEKPRYPLPEYLPEQPKEEKVLPALPPKADEDKSISVLQQLPVKDIVLEKCTVFTPQTIEKILAPYKKTGIITNVQLHELRNKLSMYYFNNGYVNSGVIIPDQKISDGRIVLTAIEGQLIDVNVKGNRAINAEFIKQRIMQGAGAPLDVKKLQETLSQLKKDPLLQHISAQLEPGIKVGESVLNVLVRESEPKYVYIGVNNHRSPSVGGEQAFITAGHQNLFGIGDHIAIQYAYAEGLGDTTLTYSIPLNIEKTTHVELYYAQSESDVIEEPFDEIDIENQSQTAGLKLLQNFIDTSQQKLDASLGFEKKHSETSLLGIPFSFSPGVNNGEANASVIRIGLDWIDRQRDTAQTIGAALRVGIDALDATINDDAPDGEFVSFQGQYQYARRFGSPIKQWVFRTFMQLTNDRLLPIEKFSVGGSSSVRGYRENEFVRDNGVVASLELRLPPPWLSTTTNTRLTLVGFLDYGRSWDNDKSLSTSDPEHIASAGIGFHWQPTAAWNIEGYYGYAFDDIEHSNEDIQDEGVHFQVTYQLL